jgi:hypothetical protein
MPTKLKLNLAHRIGAGEGRVYGTHFKATGKAQVIA